MYKSLWSILKLYHCSTKTVSTLILKNKYILWIFKERKLLWNWSEPSILIDNVDIRFGRNLIVKAWIPLNFNKLKQWLPEPFGPWQGTRQVAEVNWHAASKSCTTIVCVLGSPEEERQGPFETHWHASDQEGNYCLLPMIQNRRRNAVVEPVQGRGTRLESRNRLAGQVFLAGCCSRWLIDRSRPHGQYWLWCRVVRGRRPHCACLSVPHRHGAGALLPEHLLQHPPHR